MKHAMMRNTGVAALLVMGLLAGAQGMEPRKFGLGLMVGTPTGIAFKLWTNETNAFTGGLSLGSFAAVQLNYLWHDFSAFRADEGKLPVHYGFGAQVYSGRNHSNLGIRGIIGLTYLFAGAPFDMYLELAPLLDIGDSSAFYLTASAGARYYFGR